MEYVPDVISEKWPPNPSSHPLSIPLPAGRWLPVTMTGYRGSGMSSSRPSRRMIWRTIDPPTVSTSPGWEFMSSKAPAERNWAAQTQKHTSALRATPLMSHRIISSTSSWFQRIDNSHKQFYSRWSWYEAYFLSPSTSAWPSAFISR